MLELSKIYKKALSEGRTDAKELKELAYAIQTSFIDRVIDILTGQEGKRLLETIYRLAKLKKLGSADEEIKSAIRKEIEKVINEITLTGDNLRQELDVSKYDETKGFIDDLLFSNSTKIRFIHVDDIIEKTRGRYRNEDDGFVITVYYELILDSIYNAIVMTAREETNLDNLEVTEYLRSKKNNIFQLFVKRLSKSTFKNLNQYLGDNLARYIVTDFEESGTLKTMRGTIAHELQHAYDDHRSEGKALEVGKKKKTKYKDNRGQYMDYLNEPSEIWARYTQALDKLETEGYMDKDNPNDVIEAFKEKMSKFDEIRSEKVKRKLLNAVYKNWKDYKEEEDE